MVCVICNQSINHHLFLWLRNECEDVIKWLWLRSAVRSWLRDICESVRESVCEWEGEETEAKTENSSVLLSRSDDIRAAVCIWTWTYNKLSENNVQRKLLTYVNVCMIQVEHTLSLCQWCHDHTSVFDVTVTAGYTCSQMFNCLHFFELRGKHWHMTFMTLTWSQSHISHFSFVCHLLEIANCKLGYESVCK